MANVTILSDGKIFFQEATLIFKNFSGRPSKYNREGDMNFAVVFDDNAADLISSNGWNVRTRTPEGRDPYHYLSVKLDFNYRIPPIIYVISRGVMRQLPAEGVGMLDYADIANVDFRIRANFWERGDERGKTAYLEKMIVTLVDDDMESKYSSYFENM